MIQPGKSIKETLVFAPKNVGTVTAEWIITGDDGRGVQTITISGTGRRR